MLRILKDLTGNVKQKYRRYHTVCESLLCLQHCTYISMADKVFPSIMLWILGIPRRPVLLSGWNGKRGFVWRKTRDHCPTWTPYRGYLVCLSKTKLLAGGSLGLPLGGNHWSGSKKSLWRNMWCHQCTCQHNRDTCFIADQAWGHYGWILD